MITLKLTYFIVPSQRRNIVFTFRKQYYLKEKKYQLGNKTKRTDDYSTPKFSTQVWSREQSKYKVGLVMKELTSPFNRLSHEKNNEVKRQQNTECSHSSVMTKTEQACYKEADRRAEPAVQPINSSGSDLSAQAVAWVVPKSQPFFCIMSPLKFRQVSYLRPCLQPNYNQSANTDIHKLLPKSMSVAFRLRQGFVSISSTSRTHQAQQCR